MATPKRSALGRGLDALISMDNIETSGTSSIHEIELSKIVPNPDQPRREFDPEALEELATSIRELGIIQPISLRQVAGGNYQIIAGERRYRAAQMAGQGYYIVPFCTIQKNLHIFLRRRTGRSRTLFRFIHPAQAFMLIKAVIIHKFHIPYPQRQGYTDKAAVPLHL